MRAIVPGHTMINVLPCKACGVDLDCFNTDPLEFYNLQGPVFGYVLNCPPGFTCNNSTFIRMTCCGEELAAVFPPGSTTTQRKAIINRLLNDCRLKEEFCGEDDEGGTIPHPRIPTTPVQLFYSRSRESSSSCPASGQASVGQYTFSLPAGSFIASTQAESDRQADAYAAAFRVGRQFCVAVPGLCPCKGVVANYSMRITGGDAPFRASVASGSIPPGMTLTVSGSNVLLRGTPTTGGNYTFSLRVSDASGGRWQQSVVARVIEITTTTLPEFEQGVPYSFQMVAAGGSGSYAWKYTGTLPAGMEMSIYGHITGTPTGVSDATLNFEVIDTACLSIDRSFFRPASLLVGHSVTTIATNRGYDEFFPPSSPPKKYMVRTYTALMTGDDASGNPFVPGEAQSAYLYAANTINPSTGIVPLATAYQIMTGVDQVNLAGQTISSATIQLYSSCPDPLNLVRPRVLVAGSTFEGGEISMPGWCFSYDLSLSFGGDTPYYPTCTTCASPPLLTGSGSLYPLYFGEGFITSTTHRFNSNENPAEDTILGVFMTAGSGNPGLVFFPPNLGGGLLAGKYLVVKWKHNYTIDLTVEYTDAMALNNAVVINSNSLTAENIPRTVSFVSTWTTVTFDVKLRNLVFGESYIVLVDLRQDTFGAVSTLSYTFTATGTTHTIPGIAIPTPASGGRITARNPRIAYAT